MNFRTWLGHTLFNIGFWTFFWGAFELAYQSPSHPIWSGTFGFPIPHHYIVGAMLAYAGYVLITFNKNVRERIKSKVKKVRRKRRAIRQQTKNEANLAESGESGESKTQANA